MSVHLAVAAMNRAVSSAPPSQNDKSLGSVASPLPLKPVLACFHFATTTPAIVLAHLAAPASTVTLPAKKLATDF